MKPSSPAPGYPTFLTELKGRIQSARIAAGRAVNRELVMLYWNIGRGIVEKQKVAGWGDAVVERLAADLLRAEFPDMRGFSGCNLRDMKRFHLAYSDEEFWRQAVAKLPGGPSGVEIWPQAVAKLRSGSGNEFLQQAMAEIPWGHHLLILNKTSAPAARLYYLRAAAQCGSSRSVLLRSGMPCPHLRLPRERRNGESPPPNHLPSNPKRLPPSP